MFDDLRDLYQEVILDHGKNPRNFRRPESFTAEAIGNNPMCGDALVVYMSVDGDNLITDVAFQGQGCAISVASASMMTELLTGCPVDRANEIYQAFHSICTGEGDVEEILSNFDEEIAERLHMLSGVREFPMRVKCATLAWHTMDAAVKGENEISTE
ncbi:MAG: SUF system NifU family Fe-S cluster assembly protein [Rhodospirillales bacterium]|jgi:nitrogen fixation protein NifU and related proteins|nr:SUF system NifU family Fe-S cluster assembly protein [Rhodospirillales bacterium]MBT4038478.1 SUF system NifU family Fe-S cluster assembly protein [Rhodospirillales bacterium]MBT4625667.1 SUF system NifU family Fe-S cluster assembly protein [Rhodospirillales bacterium]MBT5351849.1 SUF system NifU family Fe-S cluster assembly protein [Rhodospirillales bacterium]MBT5520478.1 SUF system NifU family Fe-S cluster assembly protein [Rhodospirillales bacterium]